VRSTHRASRQPRRGQAIVSETDANRPLDEYGHKSQYPSILEPLELEIKRGVNLVRRTMRPREIIQDTVSGGCDL
jgi:hypothetical protein